MIDYLYVALLVLGLTLMFFAVKSYQNTKDLLSMGRKTKAIVVDFLESHDDDGVTYKSVFEYQDNNKVPYTHTSEISTRPKSHKLGQRVEIIYDAQHENVKVISFWGLYRWSVILFCIASPFLIIGLSYFLYKYF